MYILQRLRADLGLAAGMRLSTVETTMENPVQGYGGKQEFWKPAPASRQDFWKPAVASSPAEALSPEKEKLCAECGTGLVADAHFCHACGAAMATEIAPDVPPWFNVAALGGFLGLSPIALIALALG